MKKQNSEDLSRNLLNIDENLIENAYNIDNAEKLRRYCQSKTGAKRFKNAYKIVLIAAALALLVIAIIAVPAFIEDTPWEEEHQDHQNQISFLDVLQNGSVQIDSIDALNYYSAMLMLSNVKTEKSLFSNSSAVPGDAFDFSFVSDDMDYAYYELDPNDVFTITKVIFFRISVTDQNGFLASKVGTGVVDVVITENSLENMITFQNGGRFYSCLENGWSPQSRDFSTHKYIEGFCIVKSPEEESFSFYVKNNRKGEVTEFESSSFGGSQNHTNTNPQVVSQTYVSENTATFTVADLQKYFTNEDILQPETSLLSICSNGNYQFEFYSNGEFVYKMCGPNATYYKMGKYVWSESEVRLEFMVNDKVVESAICRALDGGENGFLYNGEKFIAQEPTGGESK